MTEGRNQRRSSRQVAQVLEQGDIYFVYRPRVERTEVRGLEDVQRLYMVLSPREPKRYRMLVVAKKQLPEVEDGGQKYWSFVDRVGERAKEIENELEGAEYGTGTRGEREQPAARPAGEGVYVIARHGDHTHLAYALELPGQPREVQEALNIQQEGSFIISVKNPKKSSPQWVGLSAQRQADFPGELQRRFGNKRFADVDPPSFLDYEGAELLLIGASEDVSEDLGIELDPEEESASSADMGWTCAAPASSTPTARACAPTMAGSSLPSWSAPCAMSRWWSTGTAPRHAPSATWTTWRRACTGS